MTKKEEVKHWLNEIEVMLSPIIEQGLYTELHALDLIEAAIVEMATRQYYANIMYKLTEPKDNVVKLKLISRNTEDELNDPDNAGA